MKKGLITIFFIASLVNINSQVIDSIQSVINDPSLTTTQRINELNDLSRELTYISPVMAMKSANEALSLAIEYNNKRGQAYAYRNISNIFTLNEHFYSGTEHIQKALKIFNEIGDSTGVADCYISLGHYFKQLKDYKEQNKYHKKSHKIYSRFDLPSRLAVTSFNLAESYFYLKQYDKARSLNKEAIRLCVELNNTPLLSMCYKLKASIALEENNLAEAEKYFLTTLGISDSLGIYSQKLAVIESHLGLAEIYILKNDKENYLKNIQEALKISKKEKFVKYLPGIYNSFINYHIDNENYEEISNYLVEYENVYDSLRISEFNDKSNLTKNVLDAFELEEKAAVLAAINNQQTTSLRQSRITVVVVGILAILLAALLYFLYRSNKKINKINNELIRQTETINHQKENLETLNNTKNKFFSIVAHDFKSPLASLSSFSNLLVNHSENFSKEEIIDLSKKMNTSLHKTIRLADNLLKWASIQMNNIESNKIRFELNAVINEVTEVYSPIAADKKIKLDVNIKDSITVYSDKNQLEFIIRNLVNNAIKFTSSGGSVKVESNTVTGNYKTLKISDTGKGMTSEVKNQIFNAGYIKKTEGTAGEKGTGLGLTLVKEFAEINNIKIDLDSIEGKGTSITLFFN
ncbi:ATP-binding protein [Mangrovivirga cuniculi]|uniref:histidine kinase n=1 Tax=Mangrovivirga cuniculi TaxID=2715131 RepID=A0A4D7JM39_9BACT|nr:tetratricopeptide repeat-containing sensor histidine kinase [Mangrovivirga cuniculi]QCK16651.1 hypothetical protein DCC35_18900 [Mangrovivirga cuniculi]